MLSHRNWETVYRNILSVRPLDSSDVVVLMGPLSHAAGTYVVPLLLAGATILLPHTTDPDSLAALFREHRPSVLQCVPTLLTRLVACEPFREIAGTSLRSEEHTSELQSLMRISYAVFCLKKKKHTHS